jgi:formate dehydrogenase maturation protein FdhE
MANPWQRRIQRAEELAGLHPSVAEILRFYIQVARFHQALQPKLSGESPSAGNSLPSNSPQLLPEFSPFLSLIERSGPASLAGIARDLRGNGTDAWAVLLDACWTRTDGAPSHPQEFLARAFLQSYAESLRLRAALNLTGYNYPLCPFCSRRPGLGVLRPLGDGAARSLLCAFCLAEWDFRRIVCPACGEEDNRKLPVYSANEFEYLRVDACDSCKTYIKAVDLTKNGLAEPVVDEIAGAALDLWAQERGYSKLQPNLVGL